MNAIRDLGWMFWAAIPVLGCLGVVALVGFVIWIATRKPKAK